MKNLVELLEVTNEFVTVLDLDTKESFQVQVTKEESGLYQSLLDEMKEYDVENEETGVLVAFDREVNRLIFPKDESELF